MPGRRQQVADKLINNLINGFNATRNASSALNGTSLSGHTSDGYGPQVRLKAAFDVCRNSF